MIELKQWIWMTSLVAALASTSAYSQQHREAGDVYFGGALGYYATPQAEDELQRSLDTAAGLGTVRASVDDGAIGWSVYGGFAISDGLVLEAGYLGSADSDVSLQLEGQTVEGDWTTSAFYAAVVGYFPMPRGAAAYPFLKLGVALWDADATLNIAGHTVSDDWDGTDPLFGVGFDIPGFEALSFRGEYLLLWIDENDGGNQHRFQAGVSFTF